MLTNVDNELYCYSNEFHSHLPLDSLWFILVLGHSNFNNTSFQWFWFFGETCIMWFPYSRIMVVEIVTIFLNGQFIIVYTQGRRNLGGRRGSRPRCPLPGGARGAKVPFQFKGLPWRNSELSEMLVQLFYKFASENARNAVIELQE
jgi:hypothetical protein